MSERREKRQAVSCYLFTIIEKTAVLIYEKLKESHLYIFTSKKKKKKKKTFKNFAICIDGHFM